MRKKTTRFILTILFSVYSLMSFGQGSTTSGINGKVTDDKGVSLPGANVIAVHIPTGTQYGGITDNAGYFRIPNMNVGGPYKVTISYVGYKSYEKDNIYLSLGQTYALNVKLEETATALKEVQVVAKKVGNYKIIDGNRTGAQTVVNSDEITTLPTVGRDLTDFTRLTPQASVGDEGYITVAGINNRYNAISIDGALNNDVFGLAASGTNGGQTGASPISMDVIEQFQIALAPYDVRQNGFAGANINAVTKSGTNQFRGTAYYFFRNQNLSGKTPTDDATIERKKLAPFTTKTYGASLGGPIVKNKLFFFANFEQMKDETPLPFDFNNYDGNSSETDLNNLVSTLKTVYNYDPGTYLDKTKKLESTKLFGRIDYNINEHNKLMLRHSYTKSVLTDASASSSRSLGFSNNYMYFPSTTNTTSLELKSNWTNFSNSLILSSTFVNDDRDPQGANFPAVTIYDGNGTIYFGSEPYSTANDLKQKIFTFTDNFQVYKGAHTFTFGMNHEFGHAYNLFIRQNYGQYTFDSLDAFLASNPMAFQYARSYSLADNITGDGSAAAADFSMFQLGFYAQDEWQINEDIKLTYGLRLDIPVFPTKPKVDAHFNNATLPMIEAAGWDMMGAKAGVMPKPQFLLSPRVGFNWDVKGDQSTQLRGGVGIFTSRLPLVWPGGSYTNNGVSIGGVYRSDNTNDIAFNPDWQTQYTYSDLYNTQPVPYGGQIDLFADNFKFPQMFRANVAVDQKLFWGTIGTVEFIYTKTIHNMLYYDVNEQPNPVAYLTGADNRPLYTNTPIDNSYSRVMLGTNSNKGYTYNITVQLQKPFENGINASIAYTFGRAKAMNDATSSQNSSQWLYMENVNGLNNLDLSYSDFDLGSRITGFVTYTKEFLGHLKSTFSLYYNGQSGMRYSYTYNGYLNGERQYNGGDLIYIPANQNEIVFADAATASQQWADLSSFIEGDKYLSEHKGKYAERNGARVPWSNVFDFKFSQDLFVNVADRRQTLQLTFDVFNVGNMLNKDWGRRYYISNGNYQLIQFVGMEPDGTTPTFKFTKPKNKPWTIDDSGINSSRWQAQVGIRYIF